MKATSKSRKPYWEMNTKELARATKEFDSELADDAFHSLDSEKHAIWQRLQRKERIRTRKDLRPYREAAREAAAACLERLKQIVTFGPLEVLKAFTFEKVGRDPYTPSGDMNLVEQINQSVTLLVACAAVERLLQKHPSREGYVISRPIEKGYDLWATDVGVAAEVFAATSPGSNQKLRKDVQAVLKNKDPFATDPPKHRYVFFVARSNEGFPRSIAHGTFKRVEHSDPILGEEVWQLVSSETERASVTVVRLPTDAVFGA